MIFAPKPENDFAQFIHTYYEYCQTRYPGIEAVAGKWMFRDLVPGMSDFDTRFIVRDGMTADDWCRMSMEIGRVHLELCRRCPSWARNLEHLPGVNLTWRELTDEATYYPEFNQWSFYHTTRPEHLYPVLETLSSRPWDMKDELYHLKKFCLYFGRYDRTIDRAINLGVHENKYPLHSRIMHYFVPPVQSALSLLRRRHVVGKFETIELGERTFPQFSCWMSINRILNRNYEAPEWYEEENIVLLEDQMEDALRMFALEIAAVSETIPRALGSDIAAWKRHLSGIASDPRLAIFENGRFSRLMKGRLWFYLQSPPEFDSEWLIINELNRIGASFFRNPFAAFWKLRTGETVQDPTTILDQLCGDPLDTDEIRAVRNFAEITRNPVTPANHREAAAAVVEEFDDFYRALWKISREAADAKPALKTSDKSDKS